ncbi:MAG: dienelactone hydrolase family protein [Candidatus Binatia bacterium]
MIGSWDSIIIDEGKMRAYVAVPAADRSAPGVVVIHGQSGVDDFTQVTHILAGDGYVAVAPDLFHREGPDRKDDAPGRKSRLRDETVIRDVNAALQFLKANKQVDGARLGIVGFCMGGRVVYLMASASPDLGAAVMYYGGDTMVAWGSGASPFERTAQIRCPILGQFGEDDENPSPADMRKLDAELTRHGKAHEFHSYAGVGHAFANLSSAKYRADVANRSWVRTFDFFARHFGKPTAETTAKQL